MATTYTINGFLFQMTSAVTGGNTLTPITINPAVKAALAYVAGSTSGKCDLFHADEYTIAFGATTTLDFAGGALLDPLGGAVATWARILAIAFWLKPAPAAASLTIGGNANPVPIFDTAATKKTVYNGAQGGLFVMGGGEPGVVVTAATGDKIDFKNNDGALSAVMDLCVIGRSA